LLTEGQLLLHVEIDIVIAVVVVVALVVAAKSRRGG